MKTLLKSMFNSGNYSQTVNIVLLAVRIIVGLGMLSHGIGKFSKMVGDAPVKFADPLGIGVDASLALTVFAEMFCSILLIIGLATRFAAIPLIITMAVIVFIVHLNDGFGKQELPLVYMAVYLILAVMGPGRISIDQLISRKMK